MKRHIVTITCVLALVAGGAITASDGVMGIFGCCRFWQYAFNFAFICVIMPICVGALVELNQRYNKHI